MLVVQYMYNEHNKISAMFLLFVTGTKTECAWTARKAASLKNRLETKSNEDLVHRKWVGMDKQAFKRTFLSIKGFCLMMLLIACTKSQNNKTENEYTFQYAPNLIRNRAKVYRMVQEVQLSLKYKEKIWLRKYEAHDKYKATGLASMWCLRLNTALLSFLGLEGNCYNKVFIAYNTKNKGLLIWRNFSL